MSWTTERHLHMRMKGREMGLKSNPVTPVQEGDPMSYQIN